MTRKKNPVDKVIESLDEYFDCRSSTEYELAPAILNQREAIQRGMFTVMVHMMSIMADRHMRGEYDYLPDMQENAKLAMQWMYEYE